MKSDVKIPKLTGSMKYKLEETKDMESDCGTLEANGKCVGTVANIEFEVNKDRCKGFEEFVKMMQDEASERRVRPLQCPFDNTRGCLDGQIWIIEHTRVENGYNTSECSIRGHWCAAWSDEYNRCVRLYPVLEHEHVEKTRRAKTYKHDGSTIPPTGGVKWQLKK